MGIWKIYINRNICVIAYAMLHCIACIHLFLLRYSRTSIRDSVFVRYLFCGLAKWSTMARIRLLVMMSLDGLIVERGDEYIQSVKICSSIISEIIKSSDYELTPEYPVSYLLDDGTDEDFVVEATENSLSYIGTILGMGLVSVITLFILPVVKGGAEVRKPLFEGVNSTYWSLLSITQQNDGVVCLEYHRSN